jgi:hypothetical protein
MSDAPRTRVHQQNDEHSTRGASERLTAHAEFRADLAVM